MANLRVIHNNLVDLTTTTLTGSSTASASTLVTNLKLDAKSVIWRSDISSTENIKADILVEFTSTVIVGGIVLAFTNLSAQSTIRVRGYTGTNPTLAGTIDIPVVNTTGSTTVFDTGYVAANPPQELGYWNFGIDELGPTSQENRRGYGRVWIPIDIQLPCSSISIEIMDPYNLDKYVEVSRLIVGSYWSPTYNTSFGLSTKLNDMSSSNRAESGDLITSNGATYSTLTFDLRYMNQKDRIAFNNIVRSRGTKKPLFVSIFPDNTGDSGKEQIYQIYGKLSQLFGIEHPIFESYSSQMEIEEI
jgi:hypothetical protein